MSQNNDADCYALGALAAAIVNFPLWRAGTILLYGARVEGQSQSVQLFNAAFKPPYRGTFPSIFAMTWSRGAVFHGCDVGYTHLREQGVGVFTSSLIPAVVCGSVVQLINTPLIMGTLALQVTTVLLYGEIAHTAAYRCILFTIYFTEPANPRKFGYQLFITHISKVGRSRLVWRCISR